MSTPPARHVYLSMQDLETARRIFLDACGDRERLGEDLVPVEEAEGRVTARPVWAKTSSPPCHLAAMDGIAVRAESTFGARADRPVTLALGAGYRPVNTGQVLPEGFDAVVMIEHVLAAPAGDGGDERVTLEEPAFPWQHVRKLGEDLVATELIIPGGTRISAYELGALVAGGVYEVPVRRRPRVAIIPTGSELVTLEAARRGPLTRGAVAESNALVLAALVRRAGGEPKRLDPVPDDYERIRDAIATAVREGFDLVIVNAGSSAGSADFTANAVAELGEVLVHGITIMPGKPTVLGRVGATPVMGNPGYPVSAVISFEQLGAPLLARMLGTTAPAPPTLRVRPVAALPSRPGMEEFVRVKLGRVGESVVAVPLHRGAGSITSLTRADGVIRIPAASEGIEAEREVEAELLRPAEEIEHTIVAIGSHDNLLDVLADLLRREHPGLSLTSGHVGSLGGLRALARNQAHLAGSHLLDPATGVYNVAYLQPGLAGRPLKLVRLVERIQGFIVPAGNPKGIATLADLARTDVAFINRQGGSGTRVLLDYHLSCAGIDAAAIRGYEQEEYTHMAVAAAVLSGRADVGLGILTAARALGLDFVPLAPELYELVIPAEHIASEKVQALLDVIRGQRFRDAVAELGGYGLERSGEVVYEQ